MTKSRADYASEGRLIVFQRMAAAREREKKQKQAAPASTATVDIGTRQFQTRVVNPAATAKAIIEAGRKARGELADELAQPTGMAAAVTAAAAMARAGGPALPAPTGLAAQILAAGEKRRRPMGS